MLAGTAFFALRVLQILTLIPAWGMLAFFVNQYSQANSATPEGILCLFVVAILATAWALVTLFMFHTQRFTELWVAVIDLCFFAVLIAGVALLAPWAENTDCVQGGWGWGYVNVTWQKQCMMFKASWAFGIINVILFFFTACIAAFIWRRARNVVYTDRSRGRYF